VRHIIGGTWQRINVGDLEIKYFKSGNVKFKTLAPIKQKLVLQ